MINHLLTLIWNQRKSNSWILAELFIVFICLWYIIDFLGVYTIYSHQPLGFNIAHTYRVDISEKTPRSVNYISPDLKSTAIGEDLLKIAESIRHHPAVEAVSLSVSSQPYAATDYTNRTRYNRIFYKDTIGFTAQQYEVTPSFFRVFQIQSDQGDTDELLNALDAQSIILSVDAEKELSDKKQMKDKYVKIGDDYLPKHIKAICKPIRWTEYRKCNPCFYTLLTDLTIISALNSDNLQDLELCIRIKPEMDLPGFTDDFINEMSQQINVGNLFLMELRSTSIVREAVNNSAISAIKPKYIFLIFLLINIFLGIAGIFWFRTQHRQGEMGLRVALGSTSSELRILLLGEGLMLLTVAMIPAVLICFNIGLMELVDLYWMDFTAKRFLIAILLTYLIMAIMIILGIWYPARRTMKMNPVDALHYE